MKNTFKKIGALVLVLVMMLAMSATAFADPADLGGSEDGVAGTWTEKDKEIVQDKAVNLKKEIIAFNPNGTTVHAPVVTYTYAVTPADVSNLTVTDEAGDHEANAAVTAPIKAGLTTGLVVTGTAAGAAGTAESASATLVFDNTSTWETAAAGKANEYDIKLDFSGVAFSQPGVYRYQVAETISADSYDVIAMKDGAFDTVYLDVYVDGNLAIYGYVCMNANASVTPATATKINGFVNGTAADGADKYYTYDLVLSKDVVNDTYAATTHAFPFTVTFSNPEGYTSTFTIEQTVGTGSTGLTTLTGLPTAWSGTVLVKDGNATAGTTVGDITLTGIPAGVDVNVYETNDVTGVTYQVSSKVNGTEAESDDALVNGANSTAVDVNTTKISATDAQSVQIVNTLLLISPTGVVMRVAPYVLILAAGLVLVIISRRRRSEEEA